MYQQKYNPEESLQRIKLMMGYSLDKTLNENVKSLGIIKEAAQDPNTLTDQDLVGQTGWFRNYFQLVSDFTNLGLPNIFDIIGINLANLVGGRRKGVKGVVDALDGFVDSQDLAYVLSVIKSLDGKCYFDDVDGKKVSATQRFLELYQEDESEDLKSVVSGVGTRTLPTGSEKIKQQIVKAIDTQIAKGCAGATPAPDQASQRQKNINNVYCSVKNGVIILPGSKMNNTKWADYVKNYSVTNDEISKAESSCVGGGKGNGKKGGGGSSFKACSGEYKKGCKSDVIKKVQACLGMASKYQTGNFGPITQGELQKLGKGFENGFKDADVNTICNKQTTAAPEFSGEAPTVNFGSSDF